MCEKEGGGGERLGGIQRDGERQTDRQTDTDTERERQRERGRERLIIHAVDLQYLCLCVYVCLLWS